MKTKTTLFALLLMFTFNAFAQPGAIDATYNIAGTGANGMIYSTAIQSDGKMIIGGMFTKYNGIARKRIARLNTDGTLDLTFNPGTGASEYISTICIQSDGKIIIGGIFTTYNGTSRKRIARLNADGTLDLTFNPGIGADYVIYSTNIQSDGKIIIAGMFTTYNGVLSNRIARLNTNGTLDVTFNTGNGANAIIYSTAIQSDGKIIIGGDFTAYNGTSRSRIARINTDGTLDLTFNSSANNLVRFIAMQSDGKIIIAGMFTIYNGTSRSRIARLNTDGTLDLTFNPGTGANALVRFTAMQSDGKMIIGGDFNAYNGTTSNRLAKILVTQAAPLPIELLSFNAQWENNDRSTAKLTWSTASEINNDYFTIEKSIDAINFEPVLNIPGAGNSNQVLTYSAFDDVFLNLNATVYYRLKQTDYDGKTSYSSIEALYNNVTNEITVNIFPNPAIENIYISINNKEEEVNIEFYTLTGQLIKNYIVDNTGENIINIPLNELAKGTYFIIIKNNTATLKQEKIIIN